MTSSLSHRLFALLASFAAGSLAAQTPPGACLIEDNLFSTQEGGCKDLTTGAVWSVVGPNLHFDDAVAYCDALVEGGFDDWRLPDKDEMLEVAQNGGGTHLNVYQSSTSYWSSTTKGNWGWVVDLWLATEQRIWRPGSIIHTVCMRGVAGGGGNGNGGGKGGGKGNKSVGTPGAEIGASPVVARQLEGGVLHVWLRAPRHPRYGYVLYAGAGGTAVRLAQPASLDALGRASLSLELAVLGLSAADALRMPLALVVVDPRTTTGVAAVVASTPARR